MYSVHCGKNELLYTICYAVLMIMIMDSINIKISDMWLTISEEVYSITNFLKEKGYDVTLEDEHPLKIFNGEITNPNKKIKIVANHLPWGG